MMKIQNLNHASSPRSVRFNTGRIARAGGEDQPLFTPELWSRRATESPGSWPRVRQRKSERWAKPVQSVETEETLLQKETRSFVRTVALLGMSLCALVVVVYGINLGDWLHGLLAGITLAMAMLPEEFPVVLTIFLALGAWRISKNQVLTRRVPTVETLGSATVLCVDKTGTLTQNRMTVRKIFAQGEFLEITPPSSKTSSGSPVFPRWKFLE
jgi:magnesium-transporting ATPase (P-type)